MTKIHVHVNNVVKYSFLSCFVHKSVTVVLQRISPDDDAELQLDVARNRAQVQLFLPFTNSSKSKLFSVHLIKAHWSCFCDILYKHWSVYITQARYQSYELLACSCSRKEQFQTVYFIQNPEGHRPKWKHKHINTCKIHTKEKGFSLCLIRDTELLPVHGVYLL